MTKINKMYYYTAKKEKRLNCYYIRIAKQIIEQANLENADVQIKADDGKIIIERK